MVDPPDHFPLYFNGCPCHTLYHGLHSEDARFEARGARLKNPSARQNEDSEA